VDKINRLNDGGLDVLPGARTLEDLVANRLAVVEVHAAHVVFLELLFNRGTGAVGFDLLELDGAGRCGFEADGGHAREWESSDI